MTHHLIDYKLQCISQPFIASIFIIIAIFLFLRNLVKLISGSHLFRLVN